jgi:hypothetical protein
MESDHAIGQLDMADRDLPNAAHDCRSKLIGVQPVQRHRYRGVGAALFLDGGAKRKGFGCPDGIGVTNRTKAMRSPGREAGADADTGK